MTSALLVALAFLPKVTLAATSVTVDESAAKAFVGFAFFIFLFMFAFILAVYIFQSVCLSRIAKKTNTENPWLAWIPIANVYLMVKISQKPDWWFLLFFVPLVNIVIGVIIWMEISKRLNKPDWIGILIIVPVANFAMMGYLAFSSDDTSLQNVTQSSEPQV